MNYGGGPSPYQGWHTPSAAGPPRTTLWIVVGAAVAAVVVMVVGIGVMVAWTLSRGPVAQQTTGDDSSEVPWASARGSADNAGHRRGDVTPIKWSVVPDPAPAPQFEVEPLLVPARTQFQRLLFSSAAAGQAVLRTTFPGDLGKHAMFRIDLKSNRTLAQVAIEPQLELLAVAPDGESVLIKTGGLQLTVYRWQENNLRTVGTIVLNRPPSETVAHFVDSGHVMLFDSAAGGVSAWEIPSGRRMYGVELKHKTPLVLSPARRYFAVREFYSDTLSIYETATGKRAGTLRAPRTGEQRIVAYGFRPDGKILAALVQEDDNSRCLLCWDMATGSIVDDIPMTRSYASADDPVIWLDDRFVSVFDSQGNVGVSLLDLQHHDHVWSYTADRVYTHSGDKIGADPAGRIWLARRADSRDGVNVPAAVVPFAPPGESELQAIEQEYAGPPVLKPGDAAALLAQIEGAVPDSARPDAEQLRASLPVMLQEKLASSGIRIDDGAPLRFQASVKYDVDPDQMLNIQVWYDNALGLADYHRIRVPKESVTLELSIHDADGKTPWRRTIVCTTGPVGPAEGLPNAQLKNEPETAAARGPWRKAQVWLKQLQLPREFRPQRGRPLGTSELP